MLSEVSPEPTQVVGRFPFAIVSPAVGGRHSASTIEIEAAQIVHSSSYCQKQLTYEFSANASILSASATQRLTRMDGAGPRSTNGTTNYSRKPGRQRKDEAGTSLEPN